MLGTEITGFFPPSLTIHPGDTVVFVGSGVAIHSVQFPFPNTPTTPLPEVLLPCPAPYTADYVTCTHPWANFPYPLGPPLYDGTSWVSTGLLGFIPGASPSYNFTFTVAPGTVVYFRDFYGAGEVGNITVVSSGSPRGAPSSGGAVLVAD